MDGRQAVDIRGASFAKRSILLTQRVFQSHTVTLLSASLRTTDIEDVILAGFP